MASLLSLRPVLHRTRAHLALPAPLLFTPPPSCCSSPSASSSITSTGLSKSAPHHHHITKAAQSRMKLLGVGTPISSPAPRV
ncbi:hypothetical protein M0R45_016420 [Rubus argutus]|uniref:Uncharacterized protein n=1 Tax=Rubus argutus TaxID=59490 RepID=A0AAW1XTW3_RUBAR